MRRGKKPPTPEVKALASVVSDLLELGKREEAKQDVQALLPVALAEYLRQFPNARNVSNRVYIMRPNWRDHEMDYCCFFCRESVVTLPIHKGLTLALVDKLETHGELCGMSFLAGLTTGEGPRGEAPKAANRSNR